MSLKEDLQKIVTGEVTDDATSLEVFSKDASIFEITPQIIIAPKDTSDIKALVKFVSSHPNLSITPRAAGTDMSGGPLSDSIVLDMSKYFNQVIEVGTDYATTQPGVYYRDFEKETLKKNLLLPCYTASREICTVGGMVANNSAGEKTLTYGQTERWVNELRVIFSDGNEYLVKPLSQSELDKKISQSDFEGNLYKKLYQLININQQLIQTAKPTTSKNASGYYLWNVWDGKTFDLTKLIVGSQGTLGIITEIKFKLIKPTTHSKLLVIFLKDLKNLGIIVNRVLENKPESFESYDDYTLKIATQYIPEIIKVMHPANILSLLLSFIPEILITLFSGFPKLVLISEFTGDSEEEVQQKCFTTQKSLVLTKTKINLK